MRDPRSIEASLSEEVEEMIIKKKLCPFFRFLVWYVPSSCFSVILGVLLVTKTLKDEWYVS